MAISLFATANELNASDFHLGSVTFYRGVGADVLRGSDGNDFLYGEDGADTLHGDDGIDYSEGG